MGARTKKRLFVVAAVFLAVTMAFLSLEVLIRVGYFFKNRKRPQISYISQDWGWRATPNLSMTYDKPGYGTVSYSTNEEGFRRYGDPASTRTKVWAVGDSTTQAYQVSDGEAYYDFLAANDPTLELFAYGVGGYGTVQQSLAMQRYLAEIEPDIVIWQFCGNDLVNNDWLLESLSTQNNNHMLRPYLEDGRIVRRHPDGRLGWFAQRSFVFRRLAILRGSMRRDLGDDIEAELTIEDPRLRHAIEVTRQAVVGVIESAPHTRFVAFNIPSPGGYPYELEAFDEICAIDRLECIPGITEALLAASRAGTRIDGGDDPHWNLNGHAIAGRIILDYLRTEPARAE